MPTKTRDSAPKVRADMKAGFEVISVELASIGATLSTLVAATNQEPATTIEPPAWERLGYQSEKHWNLTPESHQRTLMATLESPSEATPAPKPEKKPARVLAGTTLQPLLYTKFIPAYGALGKALRAMNRCKVNGQVKTSRKVYHGVNSAFARSAYSFIDIDKNTRFGYRRRKPNSPERATVDDKAMWHVHLPLKGQATFTLKEHKPIYR